MNGAILTVLSALILTYYFSVNVVEYVFYQDYTHASYKETFTQNDEQALYTIDSKQMQILTNITSDDPTIMQDLNQYVGGIYIQTVYNNSDQTKQYYYYKAVDCLA